jgi:hypothetical protein
MTQEELISLAISDLLELKKGSIMEVKKTAMSFGLTESDFFHHVISPLLNLDKIIPVYKLNTDKYSPNEWTEKLLGISKKFILKNGQTFDGTDLKNILLAYKTI